jgi:hypothetical protein
VRPLVLLLATLLVAGCTSTVAGTPSAPSGVLIPPRPREIRLDGVDPCSLLTPEQRADLGIASEPHLSTAHAGLFRGDVLTCTMRGPYPDLVLLGISAVTTVGIERWQEGDLAAKLRRTNVAGFPALIAMPAQFTDYCSVEVDVAGGQLLDVQFGSGGPRVPIPQDELCRRGERAATAAVTTLLAR